MANTIIIDGNSLGHAHHSASKLTVGSMETQAIFGMVKTLQTIKRQNPDWEIIVLWDGKSQWRKDIYPEYKQTREATNPEQQASKDSYKKQSVFVRKALQLLGIRQMLVTSAEADDMAGLLTKKLANGSNRVRLVTGDKDWIQLVRPGVEWFDPIRDRSCNVSNFFEFTGYRTPEAFVDGKALTGDSSDNISPVGGIGEKGAPEFLAEFGSVEKFFARCDSGDFVPKKKAHQRLNGSCLMTKEEWELSFDGDMSSPEFKKHCESWPGQGRILFRRNHKLMNLLNVPTPPKEDVSVIVPTMNRDAFKILCEKLAFHSILRDFDGFLEPFERSYKIAA